MNLVALRVIPSSVGTIQVGQRFRASDPEADELIKAGDAAPAGMLAWDGLRWPQSMVVILASGPSLTVEQCETVRAWRAAAPSRYVIAINTTFKRAPWADVLYACDAAWWKKYLPEVQAGFAGELWSQDKEAARQFGVHLIPSLRLPGLCTQPGFIHQGGNSGYQAINLAVQAGAMRIALLGYDMNDRAGKHWHGKYTNGLPNTGSHLFLEWIRNFERLASDLVKAGVEVVNCTSSSALTSFRTADLCLHLNGNDK